MPAKPTSATRRFDPRPTTSTGAPLAATAVATGGLDEEGGRAPDSIGGERTEGDVPAGEVAQRLGGPGEGVLAHRPRAARAACTSSGSDVRSPAPRVRHRSPRRS